MKRAPIRRMSSKKAARVGRVFSTITGAKQALKKRAPKHERETMGTKARRQFVSELPCAACGQHRG